jgi:PAS domain-containing protein
MVTALSLAEERIKGIEAGATDFITKPFNKKELLARIQSSLALAKIGMNGIIHPLPGAVVIADPAWRVIGMSPLAATLLGITEPGLRVLNFAELLGQTEKDQLASGGLPAGFSLLTPATRSPLDARQVEVFDPAGQLVLRVVTLMAGA